MSEPKKATKLLERFIHWSSNNLNLSNAEYVSRLKVQHPGEYLVFYEERFVGHAKDEKSLTKFMDYRGKITTIFPDDNSPRRAA